jgi:hypothetical protein
MGCCAGHVQLTAAPAQDEGRYKELCAELQRDLERQSGESEEHIRHLRADADTAKARPGSCVRPCPRADAHVLMKLLPGTLRCARTFLKFYCSPGHRRRPKC